MTVEITQQKCHFRLVKHLCKRCGHHNFHAISNDTIGIMCRNCERVWLVQAIELEETGDTLGDYVGRKLKELTDDLSRQCGLLTNANKEMQRVK